MEHQPSLPVLTPGLSKLKPGRPRTHLSHPRRYLLLWLLRPTTAGNESSGGTCQTVYARDRWTGFVRRVEVLRPAHADDPRTPPDDDEPPPGLAARQQGSPSTSVDPLLRQTA
jgi:hypothetical protein